MNPVSRWLYKATLKLCEVSLANHEATETTDGTVCSMCRPLQPWPCEHYVRLGARAAELRSQLEDAS